ncbi:MAG: NYN domain-containing protein [Richelia sp. SL_2_1]|nr:NYN domain-containing protein [Richelia sp. RM1_1_1]NJO29792.1 NYN domain-containing protein [Richelia sp. SL_2_1]
MTVTLTKYPTALLNKIGSYVCQAVIYIQQQQPELLLDKYKSIPWRDNSNQSRLQAKLIEAISNAQDWESLIARMEIFIKALLIPSAINTPVLVKLQEKIRQLNPDISESKTSENKQDVTKIAKESEIENIPAKPDENNQTSLKEHQSENQQNIINSPPIESLNPKNELNNQLKTAENQQDINSINKKISVININQQQTAIAVLLLDVENIQITTETEQILKNICNHPIQIKTAFANWQSMGKKDIEFHHRGYDLIHVPRGKDNADGKMIAFGSQIDEYYPKVKEVLVCSSDTVMTNLCNHLQQKGLTVYQISQQSSNLTIFNSKTNETTNHTVLPSIEKVLSQIKDIIKEQQLQTSNQWIKLTQICKIFKEKYNFGVNKVVSHHLPGKTVKNIFVAQPEFVIYQIPENPEVYITLFKTPSEEKPNNQILTFENKSTLEQALMKIITQAVSENPSNYIPIHTVGERFNKQYGKGITKILKELNLSCNFVNFLQSCNLVEIKKTGNIWQVALK